MAAGGAAEGPAEGPDAEEAEAEPPPEEPPWAEERLMKNKTFLPVPTPSGKPEWTDCRGPETLQLGLARSCSARARVEDPARNRLVLKRLPKLLDPDDPLSEYGLSPDSPKSARTLRGETEEEV